MLRFLNIKLLALKQTHLFTNSHVFYVSLLQLLQQPLLLITLKGTNEPFAFTSSLRSVLSPTHTLTWPRCSHVQITCNTSDGYDVRHIMYQTRGQISSVSSVLGALSCVMQCCGFDSLLSFWQRRLFPWN